MPAAQPGYFARAQICHNVSAVTGACLVMRKEIFKEVNGFERNLAVAFNDVDLCLRVQQKGYLIVFTPFAELFHHESASRGLDTTAENMQRFQDEHRLMVQRWESNLLNDRFYSPNLSLSHEDYNYNIGASMVGRINSARRSTLQND
ncbi:hypothetical protein FV233_19375 [Methylobacterium sp. WL7]|nr:hypothetical protein FV233_19375 [Methylobacterium sp. WL7]